MALAIYEMEPIGVDGALEAVVVHWFCSDACVEKGKAIVPAPISVGINNDWCEGTVCEGCGNPLVEDTTPPTNGAVLSDEEIALDRSQLTQDEQKTLATLPTPSEEPADVRDAVFSYLDKLRETGRTNMVVSHLIVAKQFSISAGEASTYVNAWMDKQEEQE